MGGGGLELSSMFWVKVMRRVLHILYLVESDLDVNALVTSGMKAMDANGHAHLVVIALYDLVLVILLRCSMR